MITYLYWAVVFCVAGGLLYLFGRHQKWQLAFMGALSVLVIGWAAFNFYFEQIFVKRYGGVMAISVPKGHMHMAVTWKEDNLWVQNYNPENNTCYFQEYSKNDMLQGRVTIKNCNPLMPTLTQAVQKSVTNSLSQPLSE